MNITFQLAVVAVAACLCVAEGAPDGRLGRAKQQRPTRGFKNVEMMTARGFGKRDRPATRSEHTGPMAKRIDFEPDSGYFVGRGYGKRDPCMKGDEGDDGSRSIRTQPVTFNPDTGLLIARGPGKRDSGDTDEVYGLDNFWEMLENSPERDGQEANEEKTLESIPVDWFVSEMLNKPDFARSVVRKFVDLNQDGILSSEELLRNVV